MRVHEHIEHGTRADMELREVDAAVEERRELAGGEAGIRVERSWAEREGLAEFERAIVVAACAEAFRQVGPVET